MSLAGQRSSEGDLYQLRVALHWLTRLMADESLLSMQCESVSIPGSGRLTSVDDIVLTYSDGHREYIQAKKNQINYREWRVTDPELKKELVKMRKQLESDATGQVLFYSGSPFGMLEKLANECKRFPDYEGFDVGSSAALKLLLAKIANVVGRTVSDSFGLVRRLQFGSVRSFEEWDQYNVDSLDLLVSEAQRAQAILETYLANHGARLRGTPDTIDRASVVAELARHGIHLARKESETQILKSFLSASSIGRSWPRTIAGQKIPRGELNEVLASIRDKKRTILCVDRPGSGKTCLLLDLVEHIENAQEWGLLFIKADRFADIQSEADFEHHGLPKDPVGQCARLATIRRVVVIFDSLDTLSSDRIHNALGVFLRLLDRLSTIENLSVVAACRDFDRRYDPLLRDRKWDRMVSLGTLDYENVVAPLLHSWGIDISTLDPTLTLLLKTPQNLKLFERIAHHTPLTKVASAHDLYEHFLDETIAKDEHLGSSVLVSLREIAASLTSRRTQIFPRVQLQLDEKVIQRLESLEVLVETSPKHLSFGHQTLAECFVVQNARAQGHTLKSFIAAHPPLPFIRPAARAFLFAVRMEGPVAFRRQVSEVLREREVAYHLKRLVAESIAEIVPVDDDWPLIRGMFAHDTSLYQRFMSRTKGELWCRFLMTHWWPEAKIGLEGDEWLRRFAFHSRNWMTGCPAELIEFWRSEISNGASEKVALQVAFALESLGSWQHAGLPELLRQLLDFAEARQHLGKPLSRWIAASNVGDDLLWRFIAQDVDIEELSGLRESSTLRCAPHFFFEHGFLAKRLCESDELITLAINALTEWGMAMSVTKEKDVPRTALLFSTSWRRTHSLSDHAMSDPLHELLAMVEAALKARSAKHDAWWREHEPMLRTTFEMGLRYFALRVYKENVSANVPGIDAQLTTHVGLLLRGQLEHELKELMARAYCAISNEAQDANQKVILSMAPPAEHEPNPDSEWLHREVYDFLLWIPPLFRTPESQRVVEHWQDRFGPARREPTIHTWSGMVLSPIAAETMITLTDDDILRLVKHYSVQSYGEPLRTGSVVGGRSQVQSTMQRAASLDPDRFLRLIPMFREEGVHVGYIRAVGGGVSENLRYRCGSRHPDQSWKPVAPASPTEDLAKALLTLAELQLTLRDPQFGKAEIACDGWLEAFSNIVRDVESAERLTWLLCRLVQSDDPPRPEDGDIGHDLEMTAWNSARGKATEAAIILYGRSLGGDLACPRLLPFVLQRFAGDPAAGVCVALLTRLPYVVWKEPEFGWLLLERSLKEHPRQLWKYAEPILYNHYRTDFARVEGFLQRLREEALDNAGRTYGRITALACLAGHIPGHGFLSTLIQHDEHVQAGAAEVFNANMANRTHRSFCLAGLRALLEADCSSPVLQVIEHCFSERSTRDLVDFPLASLFVQIATKSGDLRIVGGMLDWVASRAHRDLSASLSIVEDLANMIAQHKDKPAWIDPRDVVSSLLALTREADQIDDDDLIRRAVGLQDAFLHLDMRGMDDLIDAATLS